MFDLPKIYYYLKSNKIPSRPVLRSVLSRIFIILIIAAAAAVVNRKTGTNNNKINFKMVFSRPGSNMFEKKNSR